jgi:hypothetical protein
MVQQTPHVFFFSVLGALAAASGKHLLWVAIGLGVGAEVAQGWTATRSATWWDLGFNVLSVLAGWWLTKWKFYRRGRS